MDKIHEMIPQKLALASAHKSIQRAGAEAEL